MTWRSSLGKATFNDVLPATAGGTKELVAVHGSGLPPSNNTLYFEEVDESNFSDWSADISEKYKASECSLFYYCIAFTVGSDEQRALEEIDGVEVVQNDGLPTSFKVCTFPGCGRPFITEKELNKHKINLKHTASIRTTIVPKGKLKPSTLWKECPESGIITIEKGAGDCGGEYTVFFGGVEGQKSFLDYVKRKDNLALKKEFEKTGVILSNLPKQTTDNDIRQMFAGFETKMFFKPSDYFYISFAKEEDFRKAITTKYTVYGIDVIPKPVNKSIKVDPSSIRPAGIAIGQVPEPVKPAVSVPATFSKTKTHCQRVGL